MLLSHCLACIGLLCVSLGANEPALVAVSIGGADPSDSAANERCEAGAGFGVWRHEPIAGWLQEWTDFRELPAQQATRLIEQHDIDELPALLVLTTQGELVDLFVGCLEASSVLELLKLDWEWHVGRPLNRSARSDISARIGEARRLNRSGKLDEAFAAYVSCYADLAGLPSNYSSDLALRVLGDMTRLGRKHAQAKAWIGTQADRLEDAILSCRGVPRDVGSLAFLCEKAGNSDRLLSVYDRLRKRDCRSQAGDDRSVVRELIVVLADELIRRGRYAEIDARREAEAEIARYASAMAVMTTGAEAKRKLGDGYEMMLGLSLDRLLDKVGMYYRCLLLARMEDDAKAVADALLEATSAASQAYLCLAWNSYIAGEVSDDHIAYAQKVYDMPRAPATAVADGAGSPHGSAHVFRMSQRQLAAVLLVKLHRQQGATETARSVAVEAGEAAMTWDEKLVFVELEREVERKAGDRARK